ncbi:MAG: DUF4845 domain-containing protein [Terriglobales bacterium]
MKTLKALVSVGIVVAMVYVAFRLVPPYFNNYQFQDALESEARLASYGQKSEQEIRDIIAKKATEFSIPLTADQINVQRSGNEVQISAKYTIHVDLPGYPLDLKFEPGTKSKRAY